MIVDDDPYDLTLIRDIFHMAEWIVEVEEISSGPEAIQALTRHQSSATLPDLLILDCMLNGSNSIRTLRAIREFPCCRYQPIIVFSTIYPPPATINACYSLGVLVILEKFGNTSGIVQIVASIKSHFSEDGNLTPGGTWIGSGRLFTGGSERIPSW